MILFRILFLVAIAFVTGCGGGPDLRPWPAGDAVDTPMARASLQDAGLPAGFWADVMREADAQGMKIDQIGMMVDGRIVGDRHNGAHSESTLHDLRSATKSITSLLVGIAIDRGLIAGLDIPVDSFFPELSAHPSRAAFRPLTLRNLLTMRSGLDCDDWRDSAGNEERMYDSSHWIRFFYATPAVREPGITYSYCTAGVVVLGEIVSRAAGKPLPEFAQQALFGPLGVRNARWANAGAGITDAGGHLRLSLASMMKVGELMRTGGVWEGQRVVSEAWVAESLRSEGRMEAEPGLRSHMGLLWWLEPVAADGMAKSFQARGNGGQLIIVVPEVKLVVAVTGHSYNEGPHVQWAPFRLVDAWMIPALRGLPVPVGPRQ